MTDNGGSQAAAPDPVNEFQARIAKAWALALNPPKVEVGTTPHDIVYQDGHLKLYRYHSPPGVSKKGRKPVLLTYALINKPYIMDLQKGLSVVESLLGTGLDVYLIDWGVPTLLDRHLTINDYVNGYINSCVDEVRKISGEKSIGLLGYCMGGTFTTMYAAQHPERVRRLAIMAAPIVFRSTGSLLNVWALAPGFDAWKIAEAYGGLVPGDFFNSAFDMLDPIRTRYEKYRSLILNMDDPNFVENFLRMEMWTLDGIPMAGPVYGEIVTNGYQKDMLIQGTWKLDGVPVDLKKITMPFATITGTTDNLVPAECTTRALNYVGSKDKVKFENPSGHIGLSTSRRAHRELWPQVGKWFLK